MNGSTLARFLIGCGNAPASNHSFLARCAASFAGCFTFGLILAIYMIFTIDLVAVIWVALALLVIGSAFLAPIPAASCPKASLNRLYVQGIALLGVPVSLAKQIL